MYDYQSLRKSISNNDNELIIFGAPETETLKYNDKSVFKAICRQLGVSVVEGTLFEMHPENNKNCKQYG